MKRSIVLLALLLSVVELVITHVGAQGQPITTLPGKLIFTWHDSQLFTKPIDETSNAIPFLLNVSAGYVEWSPDGLQIVFALYDSNPSGLYESGLYSIDSNGSGLQQLTSGPEIDSEPQWSPDGTRIAFSRSTSMGYQNRAAQIYVMSADGSDPRAITIGPYINSDPAWSPDSQRIAFVSNRDGQSDIYTMAADGSDLIRLTDDAAVEGWLSWSPSERIAFRGNRHDLNDQAQLYVMNADGSGARQLTQGISELGQFHWIDQQRLVYEDFLELILLSVDTGDTARVARWDAEGVRPAYYDIFVEDIPSLFPNAGPDATYYDLNNDGSTLAQLDASASTGEISSYAWTVAGNPLATGTAPLVSLPLGFHEISLAVSNAQGQSVTDSVGITVAAAPAGYQALRLQPVCMQADRSADIWRVTNPNAVPVMFWYGRTSTERLGTREVPGAGNLELLVPRGTGYVSGGGLLGGFFCSVPLQISVDTVAQALGAVSCSPGFTVQPPVCPQ